MAKKLTRAKMLLLACALGILVTLAEPAIGTLKVCRGTRAHATLDRV